MESELIEDCKKAPLSFENPGYEKSLLFGLCKLRKEKQLCDALMVVGAHEYPVHRAVLASASPFFLHMFEKKDKEKSFVLKNVDDHHSFEYLLDYAYTGRLEVPEEHVKPVYRMATLLKLSDAANACCSFLTASLTSDNCLGTWSPTPGQAFHPLYLPPFKYHPWVPCIAMGIWVLLLGIQCCSVE